MKIGFIGSGQVAQALGSAFAANGHQVMLGSRNVEKLADWKASAGNNAAAGPFEEAAKFADVAVLSVNYNNINSALELAGPADLAGKVLIDVTNPMDFSKGVPPAFTASYGDSLGERVQAAVPDAFVVKAFNTMGANVMTEPNFGGIAATHFIAGNDERAKAQVAELAGEFGWEVVDAGDIGQSFYLEALASLWVNSAIRTGHREQAFKLLTR